MARAGAAGGGGRRRNGGCVRFGVRRRAAVVEVRQRRRGRRGRAEGRDPRRAGSILRGADGRVRRAGRSALVADGRAPPHPAQDRQQHRALHGVRDALHDHEPVLPGEPGVQQHPGGQQGHHGRRPRHARRERRVGGGLRPFQQRLQLDRIHQPGVRFHQGLQHARTGHALLPICVSGPDLSRRQRQEDGDVGGAVVRRGLQPAAG